MAEMRLTRCKNSVKTIAVITRDQHDLIEIFVIMEVFYMCPVQ